jgi:hypothetical protein
MKTFGQIIVAILVVVFVFFMFWLCLIVPFTGFNYETGRGEHTGYITAVEKHGIFFKTGTAYLKTDTQSSQEDTYCVIDPEIYTQLQDSSSKKQHINAYFYSVVSAGITKCDGEGQIIYKVVLID